MCGARLGGEPADVDAHPTRYQGGEVAQLARGGVVQAKTHGRKATCAPRPTGRNDDRPPSRHMVFNSAQDQRSCRADGRL